MPKKKTAKKKRVRVAGYDPEGRRRIVCYGKDAAEAGKTVQSEARDYVKRFPATGPLSKWRCDIEV